VDSATLKSKVEAYIGEQITDEMWPRAEEYARKKLDRINEMAGRQYGEDGYGDEYLVVLTADVYHEQCFSDYTIQHVDGWDCWGDEV
jgi:hypothetical protein